MTGTYCEEYESRSQSRENVDSKGAPLGIEKGVSLEESDFAGERGEVKKKQESCAHVCREELHLTPCDWDQYLELRHHAEQRFDFVDGATVLWANMEGDDDHTKVISGYLQLDWTCRDRRATCSGLL